MTFSERVKARRRASIIAFFVALALVEIVIFVLFTFVVFVALSASGVIVSPEMRRMMLIVNQLCVLIVAGVMWIARGIQLSSDITAIIQHASPLQKQLLGTQLTEEAQKENALVTVETVIAAEHVPVVDLTGAAGQP
jgi:hypothetical protein